MIPEKRGMCLERRLSMNTVPALSQEEIRRHMMDAPGWEAVEEEGEMRLRRAFKFKDFSQALAFTNRVGAIAEQEDHHPALLTEWGKVTVYWWTHKVRGLQMEDFGMGRKTGESYNG